MLGIGQNILTTSIGKEGIEVEDKKQLLIADSAEEFIEKTVELFNGKIDSKELSINAKRIITEKYTWEKIAEKFESEYLRLIKNK